MNNLLRFIILLLVIGFFSSSGCVDTVEEISSKINGEREETYDENEETNKPNEENDGLPIVIF